MSSTLDKHLLFAWFLKQKSKATKEKFYKSSRVEVLHLKAIFRIIDEKSTVKS